MDMENSGFKILVVDDSPLNQAVLRNILTSDAAVNTSAGGIPYVIEAAGTGAEGLEKVRTFNPDLILLDIVMPGMDGFEVLARLKASNVTKMIPVIIITGLSDAENEEKGLILGAVDYITKPFKEAIVLARIRTHQTVVEQMRLIEHQSLFDPLTNIMNRRSFDFHSEALWAHATRHQEPVTILMIDIDNFKKFNDTYGHQLGDLALQTVANAISSALLRASDLVFRWGGEEFAVLLPNTHANGAALIGERVRKSIEGAVIPSIGGVTLSGVTASIGAATLMPYIGSSISELIKHADIALYDAKECGKNKVCTWNEN